MISLISRSCQLITFNAVSAVVNHRDRIITALAIGALMLLATIQATLRLRSMNISKLPVPVPAPAPEPKPEPRPEGKGQSAAPAPEPKPEPAPEPKKEIASPPAAAKTADIIEIISGEIIDGEFTGVGKITYANQQDVISIEGTIVKNQLQKGTKITQTADYEGTFVDGLLDGKGCKVFHILYKAEGEFVKGVLVEGSKKLMDGTVLTGRFVNGIFVREEAPKADTDSDSDSDNEPRNDGASGAEPETIRGLDDPKMRDYVPPPKPQPEGVAEDDNNRGSYFGGFSFSGFGAIILGDDRKQAPENDFDVKEPMVMGEPDDQKVPDDEPAEPGVEFDFI